MIELIFVKIPNLLISQQELMTSTFWRVKVVNVLIQIITILVLFVVVRFAALRIIDGILIPFLATESKKDGVGRAARIKTLQGLVKSVVNYTLIFVAGVALLQSFGIGVSGVIASAGVLGLAIGFGAQKLIKDVISGFFILLEDQYAVGDYVTIGLISGVVQTMGMRTTKIQDDLGRLCILSNGDIVQVINHSRGPAIASVEIGVDPRTNLSDLQKAFKKMGEEILTETELLQSAPQLKGVTAIDATKMTLQVTAQAVNGKRVPAEMFIRQALAIKMPENGFELI